VHLRADLAVRRHRFIEREPRDSADSGAAAGFDAAAEHSLERAADEIAVTADLEVDTTARSEAEVSRLVAAFLTADPGTSQRR
jgi:hypothetical protein